MWMSEGLDSARLRAFSSAYRVLSQFDAHAGYMERYTKSLAKQAVAEYAAVAKKHGVTPTELALAWCKQKWQVTSTIIGATSLEQLKVRAAIPSKPVRSTRA